MKTFYIVHNGINCRVDEEIYNFYYITVFEGTQEECERYVLKKYIIPNL